MRRIIVVLALALFSVSCAATAKRANAGLDNAKKEIGSADEDAKKNVDYAEDDAKKETDEK